MKNKEPSYLHKLGQLEYYGTIRTPSLQKALDWFHFAVDEHDDHFSASWLSFIYREEAEVLNPSLAVKYAKIAALNPDPYFQAEAYVTLGVFLCTTKSNKIFPRQINISVWPMRSFRDLNSRRVLSTNI